MRTRFQRRRACTLRSARVDEAEFSTPPVSVSPPRSATIEKIAPGQQHVVRVAGSVFACCIAPSPASFVPFTVVVADAIIVVVVNVPMSPSTIVGPCFRDPGSRRRGKAGQQTQAENRTLPLLRCFALQLPGRTA